MNESEIKHIDRIITVLEASKKEGAIIEIRISSGWHILDSPDWSSFNETFYRVRLPGKPTKAPLSTDDWKLPEGRYWLVKMCFHNEPKLIVENYEYEGKVKDNHGVSWYYSELAYGFIRSNDGGQTWTPCCKTIPGEEIIVSTEEV